MSAEGFWNATGGKEQQKFSFLHTAAGWPKSGNLLRVGFRRYTDKPVGRELWWDKQLSKMSSVKRKGNAPEDSNSRHLKKRVKVSGQDCEKDAKRVTKDSRANGPTGKNRTDTLKGQSESSSRPSTVSVLRDEAPAFPRGGNNALTPLERKQIQIQATRDVLFEQNGTPGGEILNDDSEIEKDEDTAREDATKASKKKQKAKKHKKSAEALAKPQGPKIESLSFKRIVPGSKILGQVSSIGTHNISLALPNNLTGYVPWTAVSKILKGKIEKLLKNAEDDENDEDTDEDDFDLKSYVRLGQYLRASVSSTTDNGHGLGKGKKRIELSVDPQEANAGLSKSDMIVDSTVQASVLSVEDYGLIMDLGLEDGNTRGFMSSKELPPSVDLSQVKEGAVFLCVVTGHNAAGNVIKLSANLQKAASAKKSHYLSSAPTINTFLPGTAAEILLTEVTPNGMTGNIMGMLDVVVDAVHSGSTDETKDLTKKYRPATKATGRLICTYPSDENPKLGFSILDHVLKFSPTSVADPQDRDDKPAISAIIPEVKVIKVDPTLGLYVQLGNTKHYGFIHISRVKDGKVSSLSSAEGPFKVGSHHEGRIIGFNALDNLFLLSLEKKVIDQPFLRLEDVTVGAVVKGKIEKLLMGPDGINGLLVSLADGISGLVPGVHMADAKLQHPEKKFREGLQVTARILSVNLEKRQLRLTLKKSLLHSESAIWKDYRDIAPGNQSPGTFVSIQENGAVIQFYGAVRGFLPVSEMSEAYIKDPSQHFSIGQVVNVNALSVDAEQGRLVVSCKDPSIVTDAYKSAFENVHPGLLVSGTVFEKSSDDLLLKLEDGGLIARLSAEQLSDAAPSKAAANLARLRVGQKLHDLLILSIRKTHRLIQVSNKPSLKTALEKGTLPAKFEDLKLNSSVTGLVRNITDDGIFVEFLGGLTGFLPKRLVDDEHLTKADFGFMRTQSISCSVSSIDQDAQRFILTMKPVEKEEEKHERRYKTKNTNELSVSNPVDQDIKSLDDFITGKVTKARITSVKDTQLNVLLADNVQGRIDVSEVFDNWEDIKDRKQPLRLYKPKQVVPVKILGVHDARTHKFLPISHRTGKVPVFELSAKPSSLKSPDLDPISLEKVKVGSSFLGFVNNIGDDCLWLNISPSVRGKLPIMDISDDLALAGDIKRTFPIGSALKVTVAAVDVDKNRLDLTAKHGASSKKLTISDLSKGMILLGKVTKVTERQVLVQLNESLVGAIGLLDMADDYSKINPANFHKNAVLRVCVVDVDVPNKRVALSVRPSKVLSTSLPVEDPEIASIDRLKVNDIVRGFVRRIADIGLFVTLGHNVTAYVRVSDLSDSYLKEWQDEFQIDQIVRGRITLVDPEAKKVQMTLKQSALDPDYKPPLKLKDLKPGQIVTGKVRKVEEFGAFVSIDGTANLSGLCHRSEMAERKITDARKLYEQGDIVKAKILKIDLKKDQISLGLKASYFNNDSDEADSDMSEGASEEESGDDELGGVALKAGIDDEDLSDEGEDIIMGGVDLSNSLVQSADSDNVDVLMADADGDQEGALVTSGFDWTGDSYEIQKGLNGAAFDSDDENMSKKKKRRKAEIQVDRTGDLDANGPQTVDDYERLLLGEPNSSLLWLKYMAFHLELGEVDKAREIAERALRSISLGQDTEKFNVWVAMLNLENTFGTDDSLEEVFKRACQYNDAQEIHEKMASIFIQSDKPEKADEIFQSALKKKFTQSPNLFLNYANFLFDTMAAPDRGRALLPRAMQSLPPHTHVELTSKFGQLEFRSLHGDVERGRTVFEGLLSSFPKRVDLWNILLDLEIKVGDVDQVRRLFERVLGIGRGVGADGSKAGMKKLKDKQAKFFFKKWLTFEEKISNGDDKMVDEVKARAAEYVKSLKEDS
ncbi:S1 RNA binding domain containing protein [Coccidioides posadasii C735 delta SOWgp]|uniref:rRNA biogenesis protein RRP5 n=2 Tax=Coccidioides posadasii TaxID=199306 RepID=C5PIZ6_COCP7|nr:S1 RNA binding domain containing protein [Coccidioides posadasii C735 delta SOWgp]EER24499.1 S1 RNA binding domain containing protein [Coccidioides posadasii C735 delta SOWgp]|eukprot:XP_003066644.1 S1 RNA binding domain containing protein [Coccidioides posadasii C735 delta SOWgp]